MDATYLAIFSGHDICVCLYVCVQVCVYYAAWAIRVPIWTIKYCMYNSFHLKVWVRLGFREQSYQAMERAEVCSVEEPGQYSANCSQSTQR